MSGRARIKLVGNLAKPENPAADKPPESLSVETPVKLGVAIENLVRQYSLPLRRESILILLNGVEAAALEDLNTTVNDDDLVVMIPMFHGGNPS